MSGEANAYVAELRAERDRLREVVRRVEGLAADFDDGSEWGTFSHPGYTVRERILAALGSTAPARQPQARTRATQGAGDGV